MDTKKTLKKIGPGLITGASDNDPSGIATYSQAGAQFGFGLLWTMIFSTPLMCVVQEISARIGKVTGHGIAGNMFRHYPRWMAFGIVFLLLAANTFNIGADLGAMAATLQLVVPGPVKAYIVGFMFITLIPQLFLQYTTYVKYLKWLTLVVFCYMGTPFFIHVNWGQVVNATFLPRIIFGHDYLTTFAGVMGTTISPYLFFWQASQEVEEINTTAGEKPVKKAPEQAPDQFFWIKVDTYSGMVLSNLVSYFIILSTAATLHAKGLTDIETASQAAQALEPIAGHYAFLLFAMGIIGEGLLSVPTLAGSAAYGLGEALKCEVGLRHKIKDAKVFYFIITGSLISGMLMNFLNINPIKALFWSAVLNGVISVPLMAVMVIMAGSRRVMGDFVLSRSLKALGWTMTIVMFLAVLSLLWK